MSAPFHDAFRSKRVLVTGDTGFKGSWLALWLRELGAEVAGFALPPEREDDHFNLTGLPDLIGHRDGDITVPGALDEVFGKFRPEIVFHLAAQSLVRLSYEDPVGTFETNVGGSARLLDAVRSSPSVRALVYVTSDKCYRNREWPWGYRETDELGGRDPYSASKAAAELLFSSYMDSFLNARDGFGAASVRAGNVIGGGDQARDRIVPDCIRSLRAGEPVTLRNPASVRPWQHVLEPLSGYLLAASKLLEDPAGFSGAWNFGPESGSIRTVRDLAEKMVECWGAGSVRVLPDPDGPHEAGLLSLNCDKARALLGWTPAWGFERSVAETVAWFREVGSGAAPLDVSRRQINEYMEDSND